ncbi:cysteine proteinase [Thelephora ganbajun]|uniref:Cysteine proteinase n=1 Tax=Thelephora ganbajun TaxID=370292 RepID=A0ACB6ZCR6_THEGA|nr:cysteine proteinase [Thelephora ganbajun]
MTMKRKRRTAAHTNGLAPGETLNRAQLPGREELYWGWISSIPNTLSISDDHLLRTCGFSPNSQPRFCRNQYARSSGMSSELPLVTDPDGDLTIVSDDEDPVCDKKSCQSNPYCLNYLGQKVWENEASSKESYLKLLKLGPDPITRVREPGQPVGLKNLGATCYANAFLQVWFQDLDFRHGVYDCKPTDSNDRFEETPIFQLQTTFAALQESSESVFNPIKLVESLKLRTTEQQDAQEFSKLFISHLDEAFQKQSQLGLRTLVADKFQAEQVYGTICGRCNNQSNRTSDYLEIEVNIEKNGATLEDRLIASLKTETLSGENAYFCSKCESLVDATRCTAYNTFPPVLHFSILRFVYDLSSMERKKSKHTINFPLALDMNQFLAPERQTSDPLMYDLRGVLLHKGASAYHGHYEVQVFDVLNQSWYQFNDEIVTHIGALGAKVKPIDVIDITEEGITKKQTSSRGKKKRRIESDDEDEYLRRVSSKDAYMLVYVRRLDVTVDATSTELVVHAPPHHVMTTVDESNERYHRKCEEYNTRLQKAHLKRFSQIREQVTDVYRSWEATPLTKAVVVSKQGLEKWLARNQTHPPQLNDEDAGVLEEISISDILCEHGVLDSSKASHMKCINEGAYEKILATGCKFTPLLYTNNVCLICVTQTYQEKRYQQDHPRLVSIFNGVCEVALDEPGFWISKSWLKDWRLAKPRMHTPYQEDPAPDSSEYDIHVRCEHGGLCPNIAHRRRVSKEGAQIIWILYPHWNPPSTDAGVCIVCQASVSKSHESNRGLRKQAEDEKNRLKRMYDYDLSSQASLLADTPLCIVPEEFLQDWKQWLFRPIEFPRPSSVDTVPLFCEHNLLLIDPNSSGDMDSLSMITVADWEILEGLYKTGPIVAIQRLTGGEGYPGFTHEIEVCQDCRTRRLRDYEEAEIAIRVHAPGERVPTQTSTNGSPKLDAAQYRSANGTITYRKSKRLRNGKSRVQRRRFVIKKSTTVKEIKMMVYEELDIPPVYQALFLNGHELADSSATVAEVGLLLNDTLDLRQDQETDQTSDIEGIQKPRANEVEGFGGTLLGGFTTGTEGSDADELAPSPVHYAGAKACPACTFDNSSQDKNCQICLNPLED